MGRDPNRREFLRRGFGALALGLAGKSGIGRLGPPEPCGGVATQALKRSHPLLGLPRQPDSVMVDGLPFTSWFTGDDFRNADIPFHFIGGIDLPEPGEFRDLVVIGGGISGLTSAYLLREYEPVVLELRDRFGGNAMGEQWDGIPYSLGCAYVITPDRGSFLEEFYLDLGLDRVVRRSYPPDPVEHQGEIDESFWSGVGVPPEEQAAYAAYGDVVTFVATNLYPEIPFLGGPAEIARIRALDRKSFREDLEERMGMPLPASLAAAVQAYFYSSFCLGIDETSAASGWNFLAAEEFGRWIFPGGIAYMAGVLWERLAAHEAGGGGDCRVPRLRANCRVVDVRPRGKRVLVTYVDAGGTLRSILSRQVVMAGSKHVCKHVLHDLEVWDPERLNAMHAVDTGAYLVVNVLLESQVERDFYDIFLLGDDAFPMTPGELQNDPPVVDVLRGDFSWKSKPRSVLTLYWPLPWALARFSLIEEQGWRNYAERLAPQIRKILSLLDVPPSSVRQVRMTRWGHAVPLAHRGFIADGTPEILRRPLGGNIHFVNQDNWALPAVENSVLDARETAHEIAARLGGRLGGQVSS